MRKNIKAFYMKKIISFTAIILASAISAHAFLGDVFTAISDVFSTGNKTGIELYEHVESTMVSEKPEYFLYFETDFYNTGVPYIWISNDKNESGSGYFFNIYKKVDDHYELLTEYATFIPELLAFYGKNYTKNNARLLTYSKISGQEGNLIACKLDENDKKVSIVYRTIEPMGADAELFETLFPESNDFVKKIETKDFFKFLKSRGIHSPAKDKIEFLAFDLGGKAGVVLLASNPTSNSDGTTGWSAFNLKRKDTLLNDIGLNFVGVDLSLDNLIPFEVRNPDWRKLEIFPEGRKIIFFKKYSFLRKINKRRFLITINREGENSISLSFYQLSFNRVCIFDIQNLRIRDNEDVSDDDIEQQAFAFLKALDFDYDKDSKAFEYQTRPIEEVLYKKDNSINIPKDLDVPDLSGEIREAVLPQNNIFTTEFMKKWGEVQALARLKQKKEDAKNPEASKDKFTSDGLTK